MNQIMQPEKLGRGLRTPLGRSIIGFFAALLIGALIPRTTAYLIRQVIFKSLKEVLVLALAGLLTERLAQILAAVLASEPAGSTE